VIGDEAATVSRHERVCPDLLVAEAKLGRMAIVGQFATTTPDVI
jgi:hypothetical protein